MSTLYTHSDSNKRKTCCFWTGLCVHTIVGYVFSQAMNSSAFCMPRLSALFLPLCYWWSDKIVLAMSEAREVKFEDNKELYRIVENLCITAGLPVPRFTLSTIRRRTRSRPTRSEHAVVAVTVGSLAKVDRSELKRDRARIIP